MAPEQAQGEPVDRRCDLFSLGCVLYRLVTGELPFRGGNITTMLLSLAQDTPRPPQTSTRKCRRNCPTWSFACWPRTPPVARNPQMLWSPRCRRSKALLAGVPPHARRWPLVAAGLLGAAALLAGLIVIIRDRDGTPIAKVAVPTGGSVTITDDGKDKDATKSEHSIDPDREVVTWVAKVGGTVGVTSPSGFSDTNKGDKIPDGPIKVTALSVSDRDAHDDDMHVVGRLEGLATLILSRTKVTDRGFASLAKLPNLQLLYANDLDVTDKGIESLENLPLRVLHLGSAKITDASMPRLAKLRLLKELWLNKCPITDSGLEALAKSRSLRFLVVSGTKITDKGIASLQNLPLRVLHAGVSKITDASMASLAKFDQLEELYLELDCGYGRRPRTRLRSPSPCVTWSFRGHKSPKPGSRNSRRPCGPARSSGTAVSLSRPQSPTARRPIVTSHST